MVLICARIAPEQGRRTTGRQGVDVRTCSVEPLTPEAWRDLSASDDEDLGTEANEAPACVVQIPTAHWCASSCAGEPALESHAAASRYFFASSAHYSSRFHSVRYCTT